MADIEFRPDQQVPAGRYYVILRPVQDMAPGNNPEAEPVAVPQVMPAVVPGNNPEEEVNGAGEGMPNLFEDDMMPPANPPPNVPPQQNNPNNQMNGQMGGKKRKNNMKNMNTTKKAKKAKGTRKLSGYMKFAQEVRPRLLKENPALRTDIPSIGRKIGEMWRNLTAAEKARY